MLMIAKIPIGLVISLFLSFLDLSHFGANGHFASVVLLSGGKGLRNKLSYGETLPWDLLGTLSPRGLFSYHDRVIDQHKLVKGVEEGRENK